MPSVRPRATWRGLLVWASIARQATALDRASALLLLLRGAPRAAVRALAVTARALRVSPAVRLLATWRLGRPEVVLASLEAAASSGSLRHRRSAARVAIAIDRSDLAHPIIAGLPDGDGQLFLRALAARREGQLTLAQELLDGTAHRPSARLLAQVRDELDGLDPLWRPEPHVADARRAPRQAGRVLHLVTNSLPRTHAGYTVRTQLVARAQAEAGLEPQVATRLGYPAAQGSLLTSAIDHVDGIAYHRLLPPKGMPTSHKRRLTAGAHELAQLVDVIGPSVLHAATDHLNGKVALGVGRARGLPVVYEVRGFLEDSWASRDGRDKEAAFSSDRYRLARASETQCMLDADAVVTLGEAMREEIVSRGVPAERVHVVPNAVDARLLDQQADPSGLRAEWSLKPEELVLGSVGTLFPHEGLGDLIRAGAALRTRGHHVRVVIVGDGPDRGNLQQLAAALLPDTVFTGRVAFADVSRYYAAADVFVVPRLDHRVTRLVSPMKPVEAMAAGRAVVASDLPAIRELIRDGVTGRLSPAGAPEALAGTIESLLYDPAARSEMGRAAQEWVREHRTWARNAERYRDVYRRIGALDH